MFNRHLSLSHPSPVHRSSEETGLCNLLRPVQNESWQFLLLALISYLARHSAVDKQRQILHTQTCRQTYCLLRLLRSQEKGS